MADKKNLSEWMKAYFPGKVNDCHVVAMGSLVLKAVSLVDGGVSYEFTADPRAKPATWPPAIYVRMALERRIMRGIAQERWRVEHGLHVAGINDGGRDIAVAIVLEAARFEKAIGLCRYALNE